jgi:hypothetical protein
MQTTFTFHTDPGHGWVEVPFSVLKELGIEDKITPYSYAHNSVAYLEEDCDGTTFVEAYKAKYGDYPKCTDKYTENCFVRHLNNYQYEKARI